MSALKTQPNDASVLSFIDSVEEQQKRDDCLVLLELMKDATGEEPKMWGPSIIGFGRYHYKYESGREGNWFLTGFSPRKQNLSVYIMTGFQPFKETLQKLGKFNTGKSCLYFKKLSDIDNKVLSSLVSKSVELMKENYS
jgi:hypothetical protein